MGFITYSIAYASSGREGISLGVVVVVGGGKETYDLLTGRGHPEVADFLWTVVGGVAGFLTVAGSKATVVQ